jgi:Cu/Ag efflux protein CusF
MARPSTPFFILLASLPLAATTVLVQAMPAAAEAHGGHGQAGEHATRQLVEGLVTAVDPARGTVTIEHGPLPIGMGAMTMPYGVADPAWLDQLQAGQKILFAVERNENGYQVVQFEPVE